jgi:tripartite motif-containing protein 71
LFSCCFAGRAVYVSDFNLHTIFRIDLDSGASLPLVSTCSRPSGLEVDDSGNLLVAESRGNSVTVFSPNGTFLHRISAIGGTGLELPTDVTRMKAGFIAILDLNGRVRVV